MKKSRLLFGATRGTGLELARLLAARGEPVVALARPGSDSSALADTGAELVTGDVLDPAAVAAAFAVAPVDAVICTIGGRRGQVPRPDHAGVRNIVAAADHAGVRRLVLVTMIGAGDSASAVSSRVHEVLGEAIREKTAAEACVQASALDWTILRPGGMTFDPATGTAIMTDDHAAMGVITRADLARLVVECLDDPSTIGRICHTVDPEIRWVPPLQQGAALPSGGKA
ncbi:MAG: SDR family oxidoreductase [Chromatiales bacterium]|nr:SDR family oxidoreductase [Chromatiales bacterium]